jgi:hypothetical protein
MNNDDKQYPSDFLSPDIERSVVEHDVVAVEFMGKTFVLPSHSGISRGPLATEEEFRYGKIEHSFALSDDGRILKKNKKGKIETVGHRDDLKWLGKRKVGVVYPDAILNCMNGMLSQLKDISESIDAVQIEQTPDGVNVMLGGKARKPKSLWQRLVGWTRKLL